MTTYTFCFGNIPGKYAPCTHLTDSLFATEVIDHFFLDNKVEQNPIQDCVLGTLDLSGFTITNNSKLKVVY